MRKHTMTPGTLKILLQSSQPGSLSAGETEGGSAFQKVVCDWPISFVVRIFPCVSFFGASNSTLSPEISIAGGMSESLVELSTTMLCEAVVLSPLFETLLPVGAEQSPYPNAHCMYSRYEPSAGRYPRFCAFSLGSKIFCTGEAAKSDGGREDSGAASTTSHVVQIFLVTFPSYF